MSERRLLVDGQPAEGPCDGVAVVPVQVAGCPECGGRLWVQLSAWDDQTGRPFEDGEGVEVDCENEPDPDDPVWEYRAHRWWQGEWIETLDRVHAWAHAHLRLEGVGL